MKGHRGFHDWVSLSLFSGSTYTLGVPGSHSGLVGRTIALELGGKRTSKFGDKIPGRSSFPRGDVRLSRVSDGTKYPGALVRGNFIFRLYVRLGITIRTGE